MSLFLNASEIKLLYALNSSQVRYIVVGGHAVAHHGHLREMKDLDLWVEPTEENAQRVSRALASVQYILTKDQTAKLATPNIQLCLNSLFTELLTSVEALDFDSAMVSTVLVNEQGVSCHVLGLNDLIISKRALSREQDIRDVAALEALAL